MSKLIIVRGLPGSGKSTLAKSMKNAKHLEADMYFIRVDGLYDFNPKLLKNAHEWCHKECFWLLGRINEQVVVSNTFTTYKEIKPYIDYAKEHGHEIEIITCTGEYQNIHNVPEETLKRMKDRFESHDIILEKAGLK